VEMLSESPNPPISFLFLPCHSGYPPLLSRFGLGVDATKLHGITRCRAPVSCLGSIIKWQIESHGPPSILGKAARYAPDAMVTHLTPAFS